jgi:hypothetical protein
MRAVDHYALPSSHRVSGRELAISKSVHAFEVLNRLTTQAERYSSQCEMMRAAWPINRWGAVAPNARLRHGLRITVAYGKPR